MTRTEDFQIRKSDPISENTYPTQLCIGSHISLSDIRSEPSPDPSDCSSHSNFPSFSEIPYRRYTPGQHVDCSFSENNVLGQNFALRRITQPTRLDNLILSDQSELHLKVKIGVKVLAPTPNLVRRKYSHIPKTLMLAMLENRDKGADVSFVTSDGQEIVAHRNILSAQSDVFKTMLATDMTEKMTGVVQLVDVTGAGLKICFKFLYTGELDEKWGECWVDGRKVSIKV